MKFIKPEKLLAFTSFMAIVLILVVVFVGGQIGVCALVEFQVATNITYDGLITEGLSMVKAVHERYRPEKHNPWNEIECGDHYARALAS